MVTRQKGPTLTPRDYKVLQCMFDYGILSSRQIGAWFFPGIEKTTVLRRLRRLSDGEFIRKRGNAPDGTAVFTVDKEGARAIGEEPRTATYPYHQLIHELTLNDVRKKLAELRATKYWMTDKRYRAELIRIGKLDPTEKHRKILPDATAVFHHFQTANTKVKIEIELHLKSNHRYRSRFTNFGPLVEDPMHFYWYFVRTESAGNKILRLCDDYGDVFAHRYIGYTLIDDLLMNGALAKLVQIESTRLLRDVMNLRPSSSATPALNTSAQPGAHALGTGREMIHAE